MYQHFVVTNDYFGNIKHFDDAELGKNKCLHCGLLRQSSSFYLDHATGWSRDGNVGHSRWPSNRFSFLGYVVGQSNFVVGPMERNEIDSSS
jgi:hypothetical protein